jgi:hypothetical protein
MVNATVPAHRAGDTTPAPTPTFPNMIATSPSNTLKLVPPNATQGAHPLYPVEQVFLWLPGFRGAGHPYCTYNATRGTSASNGLQLHQSVRHQDENGAFYSPLFPINLGSYVCWHLNVSPPVHFHGLPVIRSLSAADFGELAQQVLLSSEEEPNNYSDPLTLLCNSWKCHVLASLSIMGLLSGSSTQSN